MRRSRLLWLSALVLPAGLAAQDFDWRGVVAQGDEVTVTNISGSIVAGPASGREVEVVARVRGRDADEIRFDVIEHSGGVTICALYPTRRRSREGECDRDGGHHDGVDDIRASVAFEIRLPAGVHFDARLVSGDVDVRGVDGDVRVATVSGDIDVSTRGSARATTVNGTIRASLGSLDRRRGTEFTTVSGDVIVELPADIDADVEMAALSGDFESEFPLSLRSSSGWINRRVRGTIGRGGPRIEVRTVSGDVTLRRRG